MKIRIHQKPSGIVLVVALAIVVAAGLVIAGYLTLMSSETRNVNRSQIWNQCVPVMEAGVEEAFAQIHYCNNTTNLSSNSWTLTNGYYQKTRTVGTDGSYCVIQIQPTMPPVIYSTAYVPISDNASNYMTRKVRITTTNQMASGGLYAKGTITLEGGCELDSYNSAVGPYNPASPGTNFVAVTDSKSSGAINMSSGNFYGMAVTGPGGSVTTSGSAAIGDTSWNAAHTGVESGWSANDANVQINDNTAPAINGWTTSLFSGTIGSSNYTYLLSSGNYYYNNSLHISGGQSMGVTGNCTLYITGSLQVDTYIYINPGSSLTLYAGNSVTIQGGGVVNPATATAAFTLLGLPTCTSVTYSGGSAFYGSVNCPDASFMFSGGSGAYGSFVSSNITVSASSIHYDQALGASAGILAGSWNEL